VAPLVEDEGKAQGKADKAEAHTPGTPVSPVTASAPKTRSKAKTTKATPKA
jgi:hypothetical protein